MAKCTNVAVVVTLGVATLTLAGCGTSSDTGTSSSSRVQANAVNQSTNRSKPMTTTVLPSAFRTYNDVWNSMGPYLQSHTSVSVWIPTMTSVPNFAPKPWLDVEYNVRSNGYSLTVSGGPKLPANSSKIITGNAEMIYTITALPKSEPVPQNLNWDNVSAAIPNASTQSVSLGHGMTGTMYTGQLDGINRRDIVWKENGWTFGWEGEMDGETVKQTIQQAKDMVVQDLSLKLPIATGNVLSGMGSGGPSEVEFVAGNTRYILYAPGGRALQIMATMSRT